MSFFFLFKRPAWQRQRQQKHMVRLSEGGGARENIHIRRGDMLVLGGGGYVTHTFFSLCVLRVDFVYFQPFLEHSIRGE